MVLITIFIIVVLKYCFIFCVSCIVDETAVDTRKTLLHSLVLFVTGSTTMDADLKIEVYFQTDENKTLLEADSCFNKLTLPFANKNYDSFKKACCTSLGVAV